MIHEMDFRVSYADTDRMGVVYYANYLVLFERGRTEFMRELGIRYRDLEEKEIYLPVMETKVNYLAPAHYDDLIKIRSRITELGRASLTFSYELVNVDSGKPMAMGYTKHPFVNKSWKPVRVPPSVKEILLKAMDPTPVNGI
ncbi:MAG: acyl-CoA thioesterase [Elusimicrobia bacterium]|jgi:acyl-CoA thioester hydrolase|nr:acyl-CoA thioesterase [Elusimicrobiota bacterium]